MGEAIRRLDALAIRAAFLAGFYAGTDYGVVGVSLFEFAESLLCLPRLELDDKRIEDFVTVLKGLMKVSLETVPKGEKIKCGRIEDSIEGFIADVVSEIPFVIFRLARKDD